MFEYISLEMRLKDLGYEPIKINDEIKVKCSTKFTKNEMNTFMDLIVIYDIKSYGFFNEEKNNYVKFYSKEK